jgi:hypothetical protein
VNILASYSRAIEPLFICRLFLLFLQGTYINEYLVKGAAPSGITAVDIQRGRWTEGHYQVRGRHCSVLQTCLKSCRNLCVFPARCECYAALFCRR